MFSRSISFVTLPLTGGFSRRPSTNHGAPTGFVGYGDADPSNVSSLVRGAEMRVAETRAVNRAFAKPTALASARSRNSGGRLGLRALCLRIRPRLPRMGTTATRTASPASATASACLVRKHQLDSTLVKRYAADFCGTEVLRDAGRDLVESFINNLADWASKDRDGLLCKLNSYSQVEEVKS